MKDRIEKILVVDLDGTFAKNDVFYELFLQLIIKNPISTFKYILLNILKKEFIVKLKVKVFQIFKISEEDFVINYNVKDFIECNRSNYHSVILMTASPDNIAQKILTYVDCFNMAYGTDEINLKGQRKVDLLNSLGFIYFDYIGDSKADKPIFKAAQMSWRIKNGELCLNY